MMINSQKNNPPYSLYVPSLLKTTSRNLYRIFHKLFLCTSLFFSITFIGQERMDDFYKKMSTAKNDAELSLLSNAYLHEYQQGKDKKNLAYARFIETYIYPKDTLGNIKRVFEMIRCSEENSELRSRAYFWAAVFLENSALDLSLKYLKKSENLNEKHQYDFAKILTNHILGRVYYKKEDYRKAIFYFERTFRLAREKRDSLNMSSMYNNIGMVYGKQKNYPKAIVFAKKSIALLKGPDYNFFLNVVRTNIGDYYFKMKNYQEAEKYYVLAFQYYYANPKNKSALSSTIPNLYHIYENTPLKRENFAQQVRKLLDNDKTSPLNITILKVIQANAFKKRAIKEAEDTSFLLNSYTLEYKRFLNKRHAQTSNTMARYISEEFSKEQKIQQQRELIIYISIAAILLLLLGSAYYFFRIKDLEKKEAIIQKEFLEKENSWIQERFNYTKLNLDLKIKTEQELLKRLKSLRKSHNDEAQEVVKELYLSISNLLQIDKRNGKNLIKETREDYDCKSSAKSRHYLLKS